MERYDNSDPGFAIGHATAGLEMCPFECRVLMGGRTALPAHLVVLHAQGDVPVPPGEGAGVGGDAAEYCNAVPAVLALVPSPGA